MPYDDRFPCEVAGCTSSYFNISDLRRHRKDKHTAPEHCTVPGCKFTYTRNTNLNAHLKNDHNILPKGGDFLRNAGMTALTLKTGRPKSRRTTSDRTKPILYPKTSPKSKVFDEMTVLKDDAHNLQAVAESSKSKANDSRREPQPSYPVEDASTTWGEDILDLRTLDINEGTQSQMYSPADVALQNGYLASPHDSSSYTTEPWDWQNGGSWSETPTWYSPSTEPLYAIDDQSNIGYQDSTYSPQNYWPTQEYE